MRHIRDRIAIVGFALVAMGGIAADSAAPVTRTMTDRQIIDTLRDIHNHGAIMYNAGDYGGCHRLFEGALLMARPMLPAELQSAVTAALVESSQNPSPMRRAFQLHETIEALRQKLRETAGPGESPATPLHPPRAMPKMDTPKDDVPKMAPPKVELPKAAPVAVTKPETIPKLPRNEPATSAAPAVRNPVPLPGSFSVPPRPDPPPGAPATGPAPVTINPSGDGPAGPSLPPLPPLPVPKKN
jgi:hypothetical protein